MVLYARDIVEKDFISLSPETSALEAAKRMAREGHGYVIVANPGGDAIGIVTEWDQQHARSQSIQMQRSLEIEHQDKTHGSPSQSSQEITQYAACKHSILEQ